MAESRYSIKLAAVDAFTSTFKSFEAQSETAKHAINEQTAALRQLNNASKRIDGHQRLQDALKKTATDLERARAAQMQLKREQATAHQQVSQLAARYAEADKHVNALARSTSASKADTKAAAAEQRKLARTLEQAERHVNTLDNRQAKATATVRTLEAAQRGQRNELNRSDAALKKAGVDTGKLADEQKRLASATGRANEALAAQRHKLANVQKAQSKVEDNRAKRADLHGRVLESAALGYLAAKPITKAWDLETAMADVGKVVDFATPAEKAALASENLKLASDRLIAPSGMTAVDLAKIEYAAGQSGLVSKAELVPFTRDAAIMGSAFDMDAESAGETMIGWRAGLNLDQKQVIQLADATNHLSNKFNAKPAELSALIKRYGAVGKKSGLSPEQNAALGAAFLNPGTETEIAGTGFKNFLNALVAGKSAPKERQKQWRSLGFDPDDVAREMQTHPQRIIQDVLEAINDEDEYKQPAIITELFGNESYGAIAPLLTNLKEVKRAFQEVGDKSKFAGSMMAEAEGVAGTGRAKWNGFTAQVNRLATVVGNVLIPPLNTVMGILTPVVSGVADLAEKFPGITQAQALAGVGLVALKIGALGVRFAGLLTGQAFNKAGVARARLDTRTAQTATAADAAVARLNATLGRVGKGTGADIETGGGKGRKGKGKAGRKGGLAGRWAGMPKFARVGTPLLIAGGVLSAADGLSRGDSEAVGSAVGSVGGGMAGAWAGGAAGAAIGSVVPGVGTVIGGGVGALAGGVIGSLAGDWAGSKTGQAYADWQTPDRPALNISSLDAGALGMAEQIAKLPTQQPMPLSIMDTIGEMFGIKRQSPDMPPGGGLDASAVKAATGIIDRLPRPADAAQAVSSSAQPSQSFVIQSGAIQLHAGSDPKENDRIIETLMQRLRREFYGTSDNSLATRLGASLTDGKS